MEESYTFNDFGASMMEILEEQLGSGHDGSVARDLALSRTHLEDALTRYNSAQYRIRGTWKRLDPDKMEG